LRRRGLRTPVSSPGAYSRSDGAVGDDVRPTLSQDEVRRLDARHLGHPEFARRQRTALPGDDAVVAVDQRGGETELPDAKGEPEAGSPMRSVRLIGLFPRLRRENDDVRRRHRAPIIRLKPRKFAQIAGSVRADVLARPGWATGHQRRASSAWSKKSTR
jgi:hypothetical protein